MAFLTREQILQSNDMRTETVKVPEWGGEVRIGTMSGAQRDAWEQSLVGGKPGQVNLENARARLLVFCVVDDKGQPMFKLEDITQLGRKSAIAMERCARVAQRLNMMRDADVEDALKNSAAVPSDTSTTS